MGVGEERRRLVFAVGRCCEDTLVKFLQELYESLRPRDEDGTPVLESSAVDVAQWLKGAFFTGYEGPDVSSAQDSRMLRFFCRTQCSLDDLITSSEGNEEAPVCSVYDEPPSIHHQRGWRCQRKQMLFLP